MTVAPGRSRRKLPLLFTRTALMLAAVLLLLSGSAGEPAFAQGVPVLRVLNWQGYGSDEPWAIETFESRYGVKVVHDYFTSEEELLTKLRTSPGVYDVVLPNNAYVPAAVREGLLQPIDPSRLENFPDLSPRFQNIPDFVIDGQHYAIPWTWGVTAFVYHPERVAEAPDSLQALWDPAFRNRVAWVDDSLTSVQLVAIATGQDPNAPEDLDAIRERFDALKHQIRTFWNSEDQFNRLFAAGTFDIGIYWSGSAARARSVFGLPMEFVIPKEGAIAWLDGWAIPQGAPNPDLAHRWIDYMISPEFYVRFDTEVGAPASANAKAMAMLPPDAFNRRVLGDPAVLQRIIFQTPVSEEARRLYLEMWEEAKARMVM